MTITERLQIAILAADQIEREPHKVTFNETRARNIKKQLLAISAELRESEQVKLPTIQEMSGLLDDPTEGKTIGEYLDDIRGREGAKENG